MSLIDKALAIPSRDRYSRQENFEERAELAVAVLQGRVNSNQAKEVLGVRSMSSISGSLWGPLRLAIREGLVRIEWLGELDATPGREVHVTPEAAMADLRSRRGSRPLQTSAGYTRTGKIRDAILAFPGNFTTREILERVLARYPEDDVTMNLVAYVMSDMLQKEDIEIVDKETRSGVTVRIYRTRALPKRDGGGKA